jgi:hypothetical protein
MIINEEVLADAYDTARIWNAALDAAIKKINRMISAAGSVELPLKFEPKKHENNLK